METTIKIDLLTLFVGANYTCYLVKEASFASHSQFAFSPLPSLGRPRHCISIKTSEFRRMSTSLFPAAQFQVRRFVRSQPWLCLSLTLGCVLCVVLGVAYVSVQRALTAAGDEQSALVATNRANSAQPKPPAVELALRPFDSAQAVSSLDQAAKESGAILNEVSFTLEEQANLPYLRYRASMTVIANYVTVRRFVDKVHAQVVDVSLDTISCSREAITARELKCELAFTAYYRAAQHG